MSGTPRRGDGPRHLVELRTAADALVDDDVAIICVGADRFGPDRETDADLRFIQNGELGSGRIARQADLLVYVDRVRAPDDAGAAELLRP